MSGIGWVCGSVTEQMKRSGILLWNEGAGYKVSSMYRRSERLRLAEEQSDQVMN
jgi:hypothetical protein